MTVFRYKAIGCDGKIVQGEAEAADASLVIAQLRASGWLPISAEPKATASPFERVSLLGRPRPQRVRRQEVTALTRELATLLRAGLPLDTALRTLERHARDGSRIKLVLKQIHDGVQSGTSLSAAIAAHGDVFDALYVSVIRAGEASGALPETISRLAAHCEQMDALRSTVLSALTYPIVLAAVAVVSLLVLLAFVIPRFIPLFADSGEPLPLLTEVVFAAGQAVRSAWWSLPLVGIGARFAVGRWLSVQKNREMLDARILRAPLVGRMTIELETARFARTLSTLLANGLPLVTSLKLVRDVQRNTAFKRLVDEAISGVRTGARLADTLEKETVLPELALQFIRVGEEAGHLEEMLANTADAFEARAQQTLKRVLTLVEPVLILGLGAVIAIVIVSILLAMLGMSDLID